METNYNNIKNGIGLTALSAELSGEKQSCEIGRAICNKSITTDIGGEFTLSEHLPDIHKLIKVDVVPSMPSKFMSGGSLQLNGGVDYVAVYMGSDREIYCESFPGEYSFSFPLDDLSSRSGEALVSASVYPDSAVSRVSGARRINIRCKLAAKASVLDLDTVETGMSVCCDDHTERLIKNDTYCVQLLGLKDDVELIDEVDTSEEGSKYLSSECRVFIENADSADGYAECKGFATFKHLMCREGGEIYTVSSKIPFSEAIEISGLHAGSQVCIRGTCADIGADVQGTDESGDGKLRLVFRICLEAVAFNQDTIKYVKDLYSTRKKCSVLSESCTLPVLLACKNGNMTFDGYQELSEMGIVSDRINLIDVSGSARCEGVVFDDNKYIASGKCRFGMIYCTQDTSETMWAECELPFKYEFEGEKGDISRYESSISVIDPRARCDGGRIQLDCELAISCFVVGERKIDVISSVKIDGEVASRRHGFTVCYPDLSDSLWSVAKRYGAPVCETARGNGIECSSDPDEIKLPESVKYMIV